MKVPVYVLGFLLQEGPLHGYALWRALSERALDLAGVELSSIYYHLSKLKDKGLVAASVERSGGRPERLVYCVTEAGSRAFQTILEDTLTLPYDAQFLIDAALLFSDQLEERQLLAALEARAEEVEARLAKLRREKEHVLVGLSGKQQVTAGAMFSHHEHHYVAELEWLEKVISELEIMGDKAG